MGVASGGRKASSGAEMWHEGYPPCSLQLLSSTETSRLPLASASASAVFLVCQYASSGILGVRSSVVYSANHRLQLTPENSHWCRAARPSTHCRSSQSCGPPQHCTLLCYIAHELQETMSALAQQPPPVDAAEIFNNAVRAIFSRWTLLRLAVDQGWADGDEAQKADALVTRVLEMVAPSVRRVPDESEIADVLHDSIEGTFNAQAEDGSVEEISRTILRLRAECSAGNVANALVYVQQQAPSLDASQGREDEAGEAEEEVVAPAPAPLPVIDEDGFETVQRRRNPRRACAP